MSSTTIIPATPVENASNNQNARLSMKSKKSPTLKRSSSATRIKNYLKPTKASELRQQQMSDKPTNFQNYLRRSNDASAKRRGSDQGTPMSRSKLNSHLLKQPMIIT